MKPSLLFISLLSCFNSFAQDTTFSKVFHRMDDMVPVKATAICKSYENGLIVAGQFDNQRGILVKIDSVGTDEWIKLNTYDVVQYECIKYSQIIQTLDSTYIIVGKLLNPIDNKHDAYCLKTDRDGNELWSIRIETDNQYSCENVTVTQTPDSSFVLASNDYYDEHMYLTKIDKNGNLLWSNEFLSDSRIGVKSIKTAGDSTIYLVGHSQGTEGYSGLIAKASKNGDLLWTKMYKNYLIDDLHIHDDHLMLLGKSLQLYEIGLVKTDTNGNVLWNRNNYSSYYDQLEASAKINVVNDTSYFLVNTNESYTYSTAMLVDNNGNLLSLYELSMQIIDAIEMNDKGLFIVGNGPLWGLKNDQTPHFGVVRTDSLYQAPDCIWNFQGNSPSLHPLQDSTVTITATGSQLTYPVNMTQSTDTLSTYIGCVKMLSKLDEHNSDLEIDVYPNPSRRIFHFRQAKNELIRIKIYNIQGKEILSTSGTGNIQAIDLAQFKNGLYYYRVDAPDNKFRSGKLILLN